AECDADRRRTDERHARADLQDAHVLHAAGEGPRTGRGGRDGDVRLHVDRGPGMGSGAMGPALDRMRGMKSDVVYDERMHVLSAAFTGLAGAPSPVTEQLGSSMKGMAFPLPEGPVGVGDSWVAEHELPLGQQALSTSGPLKSRTRITVKEIQVAGVDTSVLLGIETSFPDEPITLTQQGPGGAPQTGTLRLSGNLSGEQLYSLKRSAQVRAMMGGTIKMKSTAGGRGEMTMAM